VAQERGRRRVSVASRRASAQQRAAPARAPNLLVSQPSRRRARPTVLSKTRRELEEASEEEPPSGRGIFCRGRQLRRRSVGRLRLCRRGQSSATGTPPCPPLRAPLLHPLSTTDDGARLYVCSCRVLGVSRACTATSVPAPCPARSNSEMEVGREAITLLRRVDDRGGLVGHVRLVGRAHLRASLAGAAGAMSPRRVCGLYYRDHGRKCRHSDRVCKVHSSVRVAGHG